MWTFSNFRIDTDHHSIKVIPGRYDHKGISFRNETNPYICIGQGSMLDTENEIHKTKVLTSKIRTFL